MRTFLRVAAMGLILAVTPIVTTGYAQDNADRHVREAPPAARHERRTPRPDRDAVWQPGYHEYNTGTSAYEWRSGKWDHSPQRGQRWVAPKYHHEHGEYTLQPGRWK